MNKAEIIECSLRPLGLMSEMNENIASLINAGMVKAVPISDGFFIVRGIPLHDPSPYVGRAKRPHWSKQRYQKVVVSHVAV